MPYAINFPKSGRKKKGYIIPSHRFKAQKKITAATAKTDILPKTNTTEEKEIGKVAIDTKSVNVEKEHKEKPYEEAEEKGVATASKVMEGEISSFSLSSVALKKNATAAEKKKATTTKRKTTVTQEKLKEIWNEYIVVKEQQGAQNIAAILKLSKPELVKETIKLTVPNHINKKELQVEGNELLPHLKDTLENDFLQFEITVNEEQQENFVYTAEDKYKKFEATNPALNDLKDTFGLEY